MLYDWCLLLAPKYQATYSPDSTQKWGYPLPAVVSAPQGISHDDTAVFVSEGSRVRRLLKSADDGQHVAPDRITFAGWVEQWLELRREAITPG